MYLPTSCCPAGLKGWKGASSVGQGSIERFGGRLRGAKRSSSSLAERVSESSDKHEVREGTVPVMCSNRSWANYLQRAGASDDQMAMCFTSRLEGGLPSMEGYRAWLGGGQGERGHRKRRVGIDGKGPQRGGCVR